MDLDFFKSVNDKYGHLIGDKVLISFAQYVMTHLRPYDKVFRYGGEEFLICLPDIDLQKGHGLVDRLRQELGSLPIETEDKQVFHVTVSCGLTLLDPDLSVELEQAGRHASPVGGGIDRSRRQGALRRQSQGTKLRRRLGSILKRAAPQSGKLTILR